MKTSTVGRVLVKAKIENLFDLYEVSLGRRKPENVRSIEVPDALVENETMYLSLPQRLIDQLGLQRYRSGRFRTSCGDLREFDVYEVVRLTVQGRERSMEVAALPYLCPVLIGRIPLAMLDWVVDPKGQKLIGNPAHGVEEMFDLF
jgi:predicted aspartyl protease